MKKLKKCLAVEIGIEFKACLYFFAILFFYCMYQIIHTKWQVDIIVMAEMIIFTYFMGYVQVYLLRNFEETKRIGKFEVFSSFFCSLLYVIVSYLFNWFNREWLVSVIYFAYMLLCYFCMIAIYYIKRHIETEILNEELQNYKQNK